jgi:hypothetical protein
VVDGKFDEICKIAEDEGLGARSTADDLRRLLKPSGVQVARSDLVRTGL